MPLTNYQLARAIKQHSPSRGFLFPFGGYEGLVMDDGQAKPPLAELEAAWLAVVAAEADLETKRTNVTNSIATVRQWVDHAKNTVVAGWDASTTAQKMIWTKEHINRDATVWDRLADLIEGNKL